MWIAIIVAVIVGAIGGFLLGFLFGAEGKGEATWKAQVNSDCWVTVRNGAALKGYGYITPEILLMNLPSMRQTPNHLETD